MKKNYYAIIPAEVRYSNKLTANAKLLYGEITALTNEKGYCWASNGYFSELYGKDKRTISGWISQLAKEGFIELELIHGEDGQTAERKIRIPMKKTSGGIEKNFHPPTKKSSNIIIQKNNTVNILDNSIPEGCKDSALKYWTSKGKTLDVEQEWLLFVAHHKSKPNNKIKDYKYAWRTWYVNAVKFNKNNNKRENDAFQRLSDRSWADGII